MSERNLKMSEALSMDTKRQRSVNNDQASYWKRVVNSYEERNASLEKRRAALVERVHLMECALPSLLMSAAASNAKQPRVNETVKIHPRDNARPKNQS